jgi:hypothetical protein
MQKKIEVVKVDMDNPTFALDMIFGDRGKPMFRYHMFQVVKENNNESRFTL